MLSLPKHLDLNSTQFTYASKMLRLRGRQMSMTL